MDMIHTVGTVQGLYKDNSAIFKDLFPSELFAKAFV